LLGRAVDRYADLAVYLSKQQIFQQCFLTILILVSAAAAPLNLQPRRLASSESKITEKFLRIDAPKQQIFHQCFLTIF